MTVVTQWRDLVDEIVLKFPEVRRAKVLTEEGDMASLMHHVAEMHGLTLAEAAEVVTFRLPHYLEAERLTA